MAQADLVESAPGCIRTPFIILIDQAEKSPWGFTGLRSRSYIDKEMREYQPRTERRFLGIGMGDYSIEGYQGRIALERKSMVDFQGTLLGWRHESETREGWTMDVDRRARFKRELGQLAAMECKAVVIEANLDKCLSEAPEWGKRSAAENAKYLFATLLSWQQEYPVQWIFCEDRRFAEITAFRIIEQFWHRTASERRQQKRKLVLESQSLLLFQGVM